LKILTNIIDLFYPPLKRIMPLQTFRYVACGGGNMLLGLSIYYILFNYVFIHGYVTLGNFAFESYNVSLFFSSTTCFIVGFLLNKYVVFTTSYLKGRIQLFRYFLSFSSNLVLNYFLLKLFVKVLHLDEFLAQVISTGICVSLAFATQKYFTFKQDTST
jgi:putative flippase GtrA